MPRRDLLDVVLTECLWAEKNYAAALAEQTGLSIETSEAILYGEIGLHEQLAARIAAAFGIEHVPEAAEEESDPTEAYSSRRQSGIDLRGGGYGSSAKMRAAR